jgi:hypothetical protein
VVLARQNAPAEDVWERRLLERLRMGRKWIWGVAGWMVLSILLDLAVDALPAMLQSSGWIIAPIAIVMSIAMVVLQIGLLRSMMGQEAKAVRPVWGALSALIWLVVATGVWFLLYYWNHDVGRWLVDWIVVPVVLIPFAAASATWGLRLPWRRILAITVSWRWWLGMIVAVIAGKGLPALIDAFLWGGKASEKAWENTLRGDLTFPLTLASWILLLAWIAVLLACAKPSAAQSGGEAVCLPLSEPGSDSGGNT